MDGETAGPKDPEAMMQQTVYEVLRGGEILANFSTKQRAEEFAAEKNEDDADWAQEKAVVKACVYDV